MHWNSRRKGKRKLGRKQIYENIMAEKFANSVGKTGIYRFKKFRKPQT